MTTPCRFCGMSVEVPLPDDQRMQQFIRTMCTRACCDRCADYQRRQRDAGERLGQLGLAYAATEDKEERQAIGDAAKKLMRVVIQAADDHHMMRGSFSDGLDEWFEAFRETPNATRWQCQQFVKGAAETAKRSHVTA